MSTVPKIALLLETSREYGRQLLRGIVRYSRLHGPWSLMVSAGHFEQRLTHVKDWGIDGIIARISSSELARAIRKARVPAIALEASFEQFATVNPSLGICEVRSDSPAIARLAAEHFLERGFQRFAYCGLTNCLWSQVRQQAFCLRLSEDRFSCAAFSTPASPTKPRRRSERGMLAQWLRVQGHHEVLVEPRWIVTRRSTDVVAHEDRSVATALRFIRDHAGRPIQVPDVVAHSGLPRRSLERRFAMAVGHSILDFDAVSRYPIDDDKKEAFHQVTMGTAQITSADDDLQAGRGLQAV